VVQSDISTTLEDAQENECVCTWYVHVDRRIVTRY
jgi:hypothetical protein